MKSFLFVTRRSSTESNKPMNDCRCSTGCLRTVCTLLFGGALIFPAGSALADEQKQTHPRDVTLLQPLELMVAPVSRTNRRNSEASVIDLADGSLLLAYTRFRAGSVHDIGPADIVTCVSTDGGRNWTDPKVVAKGDDGTGNVLSASLLRLGSGAIALFYCKLTDVKGTGVFHDLKMRVSHDEGKTWPSEPGPSHHNIRIVWSLARSVRCFCEHAVLSLRRTGRKMGDQKNERQRRFTEFGQPFFATEC